MKAILIDPFEQTVSEVATRPGRSTLNEMYRLIDCGLVDCVAISDTEDLWIDDEGLLKAWDGEQAFFKIERQLYAGRGLLLSHDDRGDTKSTSLTADEARQMVHWRGLLR